MTLNSTFQGLAIGNTQGYVPPDTCGAAGTAQYVETVNQTLRLSTKATGATLATDDFDHFLYTVGSLTQTDGGSFLSDPIVVWDDQIQRFIVGDQDVDFGTHQSNFDIAVSKTSTPTSLTVADWNFYQISTTETNEDADYPGNFGYNHDAFVFTLNMFDVNDNFGHVLVTTVNVQDLVNGVAQASLRSFQNDVADFDLRPTVMHDSVAGDPMWLVTNRGDGQRIDVYKMTNVLSNSASFLDTTLAVTPYSEIGGNLGTPKQPNGTTITTNIDSRIMKAAEWNNKLVASQAVTTANGDRDLARWYELDLSSGTPVLADEGNVVDATTGAGGAHVYDVYPGVDINANGDIGMSFIQSGTAAGQFMSVYVTGRTPGDSAGTMETPLLVKAGTSNNFDTREGDLSGVSVDADGSFWIVNEYAVSGSWGTYVANVLVYDIPPIANAGGPYTLNEGSTIQLDGGGSADPDGSVVIYDWDLNYDGVTFNPTVTGQQPTFDATNLDAGTRVVALRVTDNGGIVSPIATATLTIADVAPTVTLAVTPGLAVVENTAVTVTATPHDAPADTALGFTYAWTVTQNGTPYFGFSGQGSASITFTDADIVQSPDLFAVSVVMSNADNLTATATATVTVNDVPVTATFANDSPPASPKPTWATVNFAFSNQADAPADTALGFSYSYDWNNDGSFADPGDIANSSSATAAHVFPGGGTFVVRGRITDADGVFADYTTTVKIDLPPVAAPGGPYAVNEGSTIKLDGSGSTDPDGTVVTYQWDLNYNGVDFNPTVTGQKPTFDATNLDAGPRTVALQVTDDSGSVSVATVVVTINDIAPTVTLAVTPGLAVVENTAVTVTATPHDAPADTALGFTYVWAVTKNGSAFPGFSGQGTASISFTDADAPATPDSFAVSVIITNPDGGTATANKTVTVSNGAPTAALTNDGPKVQYSTVNITFANPADPSPQDAAALRYSFDFNNNGNFTDPGDILNSSSPTAARVFNGFGDFVIHGRVADDDGGSNDYTTVVHIDKLGNGGVIDTHYFATGAGPGGGPHVRVFRPDGSEQFGFYAYAASFTGGVRVAVGDVTGDGTQDLITGPGAGGGPHIKVFDGKTGGLAREFMAFTPTFGGGVQVASADVNHDNWDDIIVATGAGVRSEVKVFSGRDGSLLADFFAYGGFTGGANVAAADVNGDGFADVITGAGAGGGPHVKVIDGTKLQQLDASQNILTAALVAQFMAFSPTFSGGVYVAAGDVTGDRRADIIVGTGSDAATDARIRVFDAGNQALIRDYVTYPGFRGGVRVAALDLNGDGIADIITAAGPNQPSDGVTAPPVLALDGATLLQLKNFYAYDPSFLGGVYVA